MNKIFGEEFFNRTGPAWEKLGMTDPKITTCVKAVKKAGLDYNIFLAQAGANLGSHWIEVPGRSMIVREPTKEDPKYATFGWASSDYPILQNMELAESMDVLTDKWPVSTVGTLDKGKTIFFTLDAGEREVRGEKIRQYFLVTDTRDGGTSLKIAFTPIRFACWNQLVTGLKAAITSLSMDHTKGFIKSFGARMALVKKLETSQDKTMAAFDLMAKTSLKKHDLEYILAAAYPLPKKPAKAIIIDEYTEEKDILEIGALYEEASDVVQLWQYYCERAQNFRAGATELFEKFNDEYPKTANTPWAAWNSVVESADYRNGGDKVEVSALWGARAKEKTRAFSAAMVVTQKNAMSALRK